MKNENFTVILIFLGRESEALSRRVSGQCWESLEQRWSAGGSPGGGAEGVFEGVLEGSWRVHQNAKFRKLPDTP